jgi:hypothetical protein
MSSNTPPPIKPLTGPEKRSIAIKAKDEAAITLYSSMVKESMTPARYNRQVTPEIAEIVLVRVASGDTLRAVCLDIGISSARVRQFFRDYSSIYADQWRMAKEDCAMAMADLIVDVAWDSNESNERSKLKIETLKWIAERFNRDAFSQRQQIDHRHAVAYVLPPGSDDL